MYAVHGGARLCYHGARDKGHKVVSLCTVYVMIMALCTCVHVDNYYWCDIIHLAVICTLCKMFRISLINSWKSSQGVYSLIFSSHTVLEHYMYMLYNTCV